MCLLLLFFEKSVLGPYLFFAGKLVDAAVGDLHYGNSEVTRPITHLLC